MVEEHVFVAKEKGVCCKGKVVNVEIDYGVRNS